jgi:TolB-like protein/tetratricopeptide (TPR) repeat protein
VTEPPEAIGKRRANLPPALAALVMRCLEKRPADRPQRAADVVHALDDITTPSGGSVPHGTTPLAAVPTGAAGGAPRWRTVMAAAVVLVAGISAFAMSRASGSPDAGTRRVAVVPFVNLTGDSALGVVGRVAAEELARSMSQTDSADVVASTAVEAALGAKGNAATDAVQLVARATRASLVVVGSYSKVGDSLRVQASLVDARTGRVIRALDPTTGTVTDPMTAIGALRERLLGSIVSGEVARQVVLGSVPPKYSAYLEHVAGLRMFMKDRREALPFFARAIALDSTLVASYVVLTDAYAAFGLFDEAARVADKLEAQRQRLSSYERLQLEGLLANNRGVSDEILPLYQQLYARGGDPLYAILSGAWALQSLKPVVALNALQLTDSISTAAGYGGQAAYVAQAQHQLGDFRAELAALERGSRLVPTSATSVRDTRLRAFAGLRDGAAALALADTLLRSESEPNQTGPPTTVRIGAREFEAHGDTVTAGRLRSMVANWLQQHPAPSPSLARENLTALLWFDRRNGDSAAAHLQRAARDTGNTAVNAVGYLGIIAAQRGDTTRARAVADSLGRQARKWDFGLSTWWRAAILAHLGRRDEAMQFLGESRRRGQGMDGWHSHTALRPLRGLPPFEAMITPEK